MKNVAQYFRYSACTIALLTGITSMTTSAQAQLGSLSAEGTKATQGDFGGAVKAWIPFGGLGFYLEGGIQNDNPFADLGIGGRWMIGGNTGLGGLLTFGMQEADKSGKVFYNVKPSLEVGIGGLSLSTTVSIPVGKKERPVANSGNSQGELRDKPASDKCSNPTNTDDRLCDLWLVGTTDGVEQNRLGVHVNASYHLDLGMISLTPSAGVYMYDRQGKNLVGLHGGLEVGVKVSSGVSFTAGAQVRRHNKNDRYENDNRTQGVFSAGLTWNFGGGLDDTSSNFVNRAPRRTVFERGLQTQQKTGRHFEEKAGLGNSNTQATVQSVKFVDATSMNPHTRIANLADGELMIVSGNVNFAAMAEIANHNVFVVGGGSYVDLKTLSGKSGSFLAPGVRPTITAGNVSAVFRTTDRHNVIFQGLDIVGNGANTTRAFHIRDNSNYVRVDDVSVKDVTTHAVHIVNASDNNTINNLRVDNVGAANEGIIKVDSSYSTIISNVNMRNLQANSIGLVMTNNADFAKVSGLDIDDADANYQSALRIDNNSDHNIIERSTFKNFAANGIVIDGDASDYNELHHLTLTTAATTNGNGILLSNGPDHITISNITLTGSNVNNFRALQLSDNSQNIKIGNVHAINWDEGFGLENNMSSVVDMGGNRFTGDSTQFACDGVVSVNPGLQVTVDGGAEANGGVSQICQ